MGAFFIRWCGRDGKMWYPRDMGADDAKQRETHFVSGFAVHAQRIFQTIDAERRVHAVADPPGQHPPRRPVDDRYPIHEAARQPKVGDVRAPDRVRSGNRDAAQQVGIDPMFRMLDAGSIAPAPVLPAVDPAHFHSGTTIIRWYPLVRYGVENAKLAPGYQALAAQASPKG